MLDPSKWGCISDDAIPVYDIKRSEDEDIREEEPELFEQILIQCNLLAHFIIGIEYRPCSLWRGVFLG